MCCTLHQDRRLKVVETLLIRSPTKDPSKHNCTILSTGLWKGLLWLSRICITSEFVYEQIFHNLSELALLGTAKHKLLYLLNTFCWIFKPNFNRYWHYCKLKCSFLHFYCKSCEKIKEEQSGMFWHICSLDKYLLRTDTVLCFLKF